MATIVKQLHQLVQDKADMKNNLETQGITGLSDIDTFTTMIPKILDIQGGGEKKYTGHVDTEGLKIIGYDDETIAWYNENGVNWNEEQDNFFKLTDEDKSYYGLGEDDILQLNPAINKKQFDISYMPNFEISLTRNSLSYGLYSYYSLKTIPLLNTQNVTNMSYMFVNCYSLVAIPQLNTQNVINMSYMFANCYSLKVISLLNTQNVTSMNSMFSNCYSLVAIPQLSTRNVTNMSYMFSNCYSLVTISQLNTEKVTNMYNMFNSCGSLVTIPQLNTQNVINMSYMFANCCSLKTIPLLNTQNVTSMNNMFSNCYSLKTIPLLNTQNVTSMSYMFYNCYSLKTIDLSDCDLTKVTSFGSMFNGCGVNLPSGQLTKVYVKDEASQNWVLTKSNGHPNSWSTNNVIIAGSEQDLRIK